MDYIQIGFQNTYMVGLELNEWNINAQNGAINDKQPFKTKPEFAYWMKSTYLRHLYK